MCGGTHFVPKAKFSDDSMLGVHDYHGDHTFVVNLICVTSISQEEVTRECIVCLHFSGFTVCWHSLCISGQTLVMFAGCYMCC